MLNETIYNEMPIIVFQQELDDEDVTKLVALFEKWFQDEIDKRMTKKGKLFEFAYTNVEVSSSLMFGTHNNKKYVNIMEGYCGDYFKQQVIHKFYQRIVEDSLKIADRLVAENNLTATIEKTEGIALHYVVSR